MAYVPEDYSFEVVYMDNNDIIDFMAFSKQVFKTAMLTDIHSTKTAKIRSIMWFSYGQSEVTDAQDGTTSVVDHANEIWGRCTLNELETWSE